VANIREGYKRPTTKECLDFYGYAHASLEEVRGFIEDARDDGILASKPGSALKDLGIELKPIPYHRLLRPPKVSYDPLGEIKRIIGDVKRGDLTFEIFLELLNKTDYLMKRAVEGLQAKMEKDEDAKKHGAAGVWERKYLS
ncbi:MAG: four helix bundle protein, partial [Patescibacteria group bacterium]